MWDEPVGEVRGSKESAISKQHKASPNLQEPSKG